MEVDSPLLQKLLHLKERLHLQTLLPFGRRFLPVIIGLTVATIGVVLVTKSVYHLKNTGKREVTSSTVNRLNRQLQEIRARIQAQNSAPLDTSKPSPLGPISSSAGLSRHAPDENRDYLDPAIARSPSEVVDLQKRGERDYQVFQVERSNRFRRVGPIRVSLRNTDVTRQTFDVALELNGVQLQKFNVKRQERLRLFTNGGKQSIEVVINQIGEDQITGYVSAPRRTGRTASVS